MSSQMPKIKINVDPDVVDQDQTDLTEMTIVPTRPCYMCGKSGSVQVPTEEWDLYVASKDDDSSPFRFIQTACPSTSDEVREQIISGTHPDCWNKIFPKDDED